MTAVLVKHRPAGLLRDIADEEDAVKVFVDLVSQRYDIVDRYGIGEIASAAEPNDLEAFSASGNGGRVPYTSGGIGADRFSDGGSGG